MACEPNPERVAAMARQYYDDLESRLALTEQRLQRAVEALQKIQQWAEKGMESTSGTTSFHFADIEKRARSALEDLTNDKD